MIKFNFNTYMPKLSTEGYNDKISKIKDELEHSNYMNEWYRLDIDQELLTNIKETSNYIRLNCDVFIVIGIGGSFLGAKSVIEALTPYFNKSKPEIIFVGTSLSGSYLEELDSYISNKDVIINVISKSGTTLEPSLAFDYLYEKMKEKYKIDYQKRIIVTTDMYDGELRELVNKEKFHSFDIPREIGGRYSVFTPVGLLPIAVAGIDIDELIKGACECDLEDAFNYAISRDLMYKNEKIVESFTIYEPKLNFFTEWLKQLFGETQGKDKKGILPISMLNTRDLHSLGQFYQDGNPIIFETVIDIVNTSKIVSKRYGKTFDQINSAAVTSVAEAHKKSDTYSNIISIDILTPYNIGYLYFFFMVAAATGGYLLNVDPFNQPGVNTYKDLIKEKLKN